MIKYLDKKMISFLVGQVERVIVERVEELNRKDTVNELNLFNTGIYVDLKQFEKGIYKIAFKNLNKKYRKKQRKDGDL